MAKGYQANKDRQEQINLARKRSLVADIHAENLGAPVPFFREPVERRGQRRLRPEMGLRARIVEEEKPPLSVEGQCASSEKMVSSNAFRCGLVMEAIQPLSSANISSRSRLEAGRKSAMSISVSASNCRR